MSVIEHPERDDTAVKVAEALWPQRYMGDLTTAEWAKCYAIVDAANDQLRGAVEAAREQIKALVMAQSAAGYVETAGWALLLDEIDKLPLQDRQR
jgi:hypothetical protein